MKKILLLLTASSSISLMAMDQQKQIIPIQAPPFEVPPPYAPESSSSASYGYNKPQPPAEDANAKLASLLRARHERMLNDEEHIQLNAQTASAPAADALSREIRKHLQLGRQAYNDEFYPDASFHYQQLERLVANAQNISPIIEIQTLYYLANIYDRYLLPKALGQAYFNKVRDACNTVIAGNDPASQLSIEATMHRSFLPHHL